MNASSGPVDCTVHFSDYLDTQTTDTCHVCLSTGAVVGLSFHAQTGLVSLISLLVLLGIIAVNYWRKRAQTNGQLRLFRGNIDILMLNLIVADIVMSLGAISDIYWAHHRQVFCGSFCNAQGVLQTMGETAAALSTLTVTIYTFMAIRRNRHTFRPWTCLAVVAAIWLWVLLWAVVPLVVTRNYEPDEEGNVRNFYSPTPWWCWINGRYMAERVVAEYLWLWIAGVGSIALYVPAYFTVRRQRHAAEPGELRRLPMGIGRFYQPEQLDARRPSESDARSVASSVHENDGAVKLLWYPFVYTLCVLPLSIIRWAGFVNPDILTSSRVKTSSMVFISIFNLMGLFNVVLILLTRPAVLLMESHEVTGESKAPSKEDLGAPITQVDLCASEGLNYRDSQHKRAETEGTYIE